MQDYNPIFISVLVLEFIELVVLLASVSISKSMPEELLDVDMAPSLWVLAGVPPNSFSERDLCLCLSDIGFRRLQACFSFCARLGAERVIQVVEFGSGGCHHGEKLTYLRFPWPLPGLSFGIA